MNRMTKNFLLLVSVVLLASACATATDTTAAAMPNAVPESDIAAIVTAANEGEIQQGNAAASRATSADVRAFAQMMVADHTNALNTGRDVFTRNGVTPSENYTSRKLRDNSQLTVTNLATYTGADFDRTYMQVQVDLHQWLLTVLDTILIPSARNAEVRALLQTQRGSVAAHLERARTIRAAL
jgi:putative membrane protein